MRIFQHYYVNNQYFRSIKQDSPVGTLLFVHGLGESGLCFEKLGVELQTLEHASQWDILIPDLTGYGRSLPADNSVTLADFAQKCTQLADNLPGPVVLIGHSMGGVIGLLAMETHPSSYKGFVNIEGNLTPGDCVFSGQAATYTIDEFIDNGFNKLQNAVYENGTQFSAQKGYYASMRFADPDQFYLNSIELTDFSAPETGASRFKNLNVPSLYIGGAPRGICQSSIDRLQESGVPAKFVENTGHWPFIDHIRITAKLIDNFLDE